jgi:hypothetical protein
MKNTTVLIALALLAVCTAPLIGQEYPKAEIDNGVLKAGLYLPDAENGSYRSSRFDWSGIIYSLEYKGHQFYGMWYPRHNPLVNDSITGPAEAFEPADGGLGYAEAATGGQFIRIGVGVVEKPEERAFSAYKTYKLLDPGKWKVSRGDNWIEFEHTLNTQLGYSYVYTKRITLVTGKPEMLIEHSLKNTGAKVITTRQYNHNFFVMDGKMSGPGITVKFPYEVKAVTGFRGVLETKGRELVYLQELQGNQSAQSLLEGYGATAQDHTFTVENKLSGTGVKVTGDHPVVHFNFWTRKETVCPEPYVQLQVQPGSTENWRTHYEFFTLD